MQDYTEKRTYERIPLLAYATNKCCQLVGAMGRLRVDLVDIGNGGARVRMKDPLTMARGYCLRFSLECTGTKELLQNIEASVCWQAGQDVGLRFDTPLGLPLRTLQDLVS